MEEIRRQQWDQNQTSRPYLMSHCASTLSGLNISFVLYDAEKMFYVA